MRKSSLNCVETTAVASLFIFNIAYDSESLVNGDASPVAAETCQMRKFLLGNLDAVISKPLLSGSHARFLMSKNFSLTNPCSLPLSNSPSSNSNSFEEPTDVPAAKAIDFPSGAKRLSPMRNGCGRETIFLSLLPSAASATQSEQNSSARCGQRTKEICLPSGEMLIQPSVPLRI